MFPSPASQGPPPPDARPQGQPSEPAPVPPSIISQQGQQKIQQQGQEDSIQKQTLNMAVQKLTEYKNSLEGLLTAMKAIDPESVSLFMPLIEGGKALEAKLQQAMQRINANQPNMAGMSGSGQPQQAPGGASAAGI